MKLVKLIFVLFNVLLNVIYYIVSSPVLIPFGIYKCSKNRKWRKNIKVGDRCFFINSIEERSYGDVTAISDDKLRARVEMKDFGSRSVGWYEIDCLMII